jgi:hypothetical protein
METVPPDAARSVWGGIARVWRHPLDHAEFSPPFRQRVRTAGAREECYGVVGFLHINGEPVHLPAVGGFHHVANATTCDTHEVKGDLILTIVDHVGGEGRPAKEMLANAAVVHSIAPSETVRRRRPVFLFIAEIVLDTRFGVLYE